MAHIESAHISGQTEGDLEASRKDLPLEEGMATHSHILAWRIHGQRSPAVGCSGLQSIGSHRVGQD